MSVLFTPYGIGRMEIENRFVRSATYYALADPNGFIGDDSVDLMKLLAQNQVGLIITGYAMVDKTGQSFVDMNGIQTDDHIPGYIKMTKVVHERDGKIAMQIAHCGSGSTWTARSDGDFMAVSIIEDMPDWGKPAREMTEDDIRTIIENFGKAASRVEEAGFDGVQIHGAHGYLVSQFLSPITNRRDDIWGGSLENRMRFAIEVTRAIKSKVDSDFPVMIKLGCHDYDERGGLTIEEGAAVAKALEDEGICFTEVSHSLVDREGRKMTMGVTSPEKEAYYLADARVVREATEGPIGLVGGMRSIPVMEEVINSGTADFITICRPLIREPGLIKRWQQGDDRPAECITCGHCFNRDDEGKINVYCYQLKKKQQGM